MPPLLSTVPRALVVGTPPITGRVVTNNGCRVQLTNPTTPSNRATQLATPRERRVVGEAVEGVDTFFKHSECVDLCLHKLGRWTDCTLRESSARDASNAVSVVTVLEWRSECRSTKSHFCPPSGSAFLGVLALGRWLSSWGL